MTCLGFFLVARLLVSHGFCFLSPQKNTHHYNRNQVEILFVLFLLSAFALEVGFGLEFLEIGFAIHEFTISMVCKVGRKLVWFL